MKASWCYTEKKDQFLSRIVTLMFDTYPITIVAVFIFFSPIIIIICEKQFARLTDFSFYCLTSKSDDASCSI